MPDARSGFVSFLLLLVLAIVACGEDITGPDAVATVEVTPGSATLNALGATQDFTAEARTSSGKKVRQISFRWETADSRVATVNGQGVATAKGNGTTQVRATVIGTQLSGSSRLTVDQTVASVEVTPDSSRLTALQDTADFDAAVADANDNPISGIAVTWSLRDTSVATVDENGRTTSRRDGRTDLVAEVAGQADTATVIVEAMSEKTLGPGGGSLSSSDGRLQLTVPQGALDQSRDLKIQATISSRSEVVWGQPLQLEYRLQPSGLQFRDSVTVKWSLEDQDLPSNANIEGWTVIQLSADGELAEVLPLTLVRSERAATTRITHFSKFLSLFVPRGDSGWKVWDVRWGIEPVDWYVEDHPPEVNRSWLTADRVRTALGKWDAEESQMKFNRVDTRDEAELIFEESGSVSLLEGGLCANGIRIRAILGVTCYGFLSQIFESELEEDDSIVIRIASDDIGSGEAALTVLMHETGHALGIQHTWKSNLSPPSVMAPGGENVLPTELSPVDLGALHYHYPANQPPNASIAQPTSGETVAAGAMVEFVGSGEDPEDGRLSGSALLWSSSKDGRIGQGEEISASLSEGDHSIQLLATDLDGKQADTSIQLTAVDPAPTIADGESEVLDLNGCEIEQRTGTLNVNRFQYTDPDGDIIEDQAKVHVRWKFFPDGSSGEQTIPLSNESITRTGDMRSGEIEALRCTRFAEQTRLERDWTLEDAAGNVSNTLTIIFEKPEGAAAISPGYKPSAESAATKSDTTNR